MVTRIPFLVVLIALSACGENKGSFGYRCPDGTRFSVINNGDEREEFCVDVDGRKQGPYVRLRGSVPFELGSFSADRRDGAWIALWDGRSVRSVVHHVNGAPTGTTVTLFDNMVLSTARHDIGGDRLWPECRFEHDGGRLSAGFSSGEALKGVWALIDKGEMRVQRYRNDGTSTALLPVEVAP